MSEKISPTGLNLGALLPMFLGSGSSKTTSSTKSNITEEGMDQLVKKILSSDAGLAAIAQGEKQAGLYNSTVNQQLVTNLVTETAGELAARKAGTTQTTNNTGTSPQIDPLKAGGALALYSILQPSLKQAGLIGGNTGILGTAGNAIRDLLFGQTSNTAGDEKDLATSDELENSSNIWDSFDQPAFDWNNLPDDMLDPSYGE